MDKIKCCSATKGLAGFTTSLARKLHDTATKAQEENLLEAAVLLAQAATLTTKAAASMKALTISWPFTK